MPISLAQGLGEGLVGMSAAYSNAQKEAEDRKRKQAQEDTQAQRQDQMWQERTDTQNAEAIEARHKLTQIADPSNPYWKIHDWKEQALNQAEPTNPKPVQNAPNPVGIASIKLPDNQVGPPAPAPRDAAHAPSMADQTKALGIPPPEWQGPTDPEFNQADRQYRALNKEIGTGIARIHDAAGGDQAKENRMLTAYYKIKQPEIDKLDQDIQAYGQKAQSQIVTARANQFVDELDNAATRPEVIEEMYGPGAKAGTDSRTGLQGVILPDADGTFIGGDVVLAKRMREAGLMDAKEYGKIQMENAKDIANIIKQKGIDSTKIAAAQQPHVSISVHPEGNNAKIQEAEALKRNAEDQARADGKKPKEVAEAGRAAYGRHLANPENRTEGLQNAALQRLQQAGKKETAGRVQSWIKAAVQKDPLGGEAKEMISPKEALNQFLRFSKEDPDAAIAYRGGLTEHLGTEIDAYLDKKGKESSPVKSEAADKPTSTKTAGKPDTIKTKDGRDAYLWSDGKYHTSGPEKK
jgi:hypothetical protein